MRLTRFTSVSQTEPKVRSFIDSFWAKIFSGKLEPIIIIMALLMSFCCAAAFMSWCLIIATGY